MQDILVSANDLAVAGELACADAHELAAQAGITPGEFGATVNRETGLRFARCQLGLFGFGPKAEGKSKIVLKATNVPDDLAEALRAKAVNGRIPCSTVWDIAEQFKYPRLGVANVIEALGLRVAPCQLGCF